MSIILQAISRNYPDLSVSKRSRLIRKNRYFPASQRNSTRERIDEPFLPVISSENELKVPVDRGGESRSLFDLSGKNIMVGVSLLVGALMIGLIWGVGMRHGQVRAGVGKEWSEKNMNRPGVQAGVATEFPQFIQAQSGMVVGSADNQLPESFQSDPVESSLSPVSLNPMSPGLEPSQQIKKIVVQPSESLERPKLIVEGIFWYNGDPSAIINGEIYKTGDVINSAVVKRIHKNSIDFEFHGNKFSICP